MTEEKLEEKVGTDNSVVTIRNDITGIDEIKKLNQGDLVFMTYRHAPKKPYNLLGDYTRITGYVTEITPTTITLSNFDPDTSHRSFFFRLFNEKRQIYLQEKIAELEKLERTYSWQK